MEWCAAAQRNPPTSLILCSLCPSSSPIPGDAQRSIEIMLTSAGDENLFSIKAQQMRECINAANSGVGQDALAWPRDLQDDLVFG